MAEIDVETTREWIAEIRTGTNTTKGRGLEDLMETLCETVPGLELMRRRGRNLKNTAEIDLAFRVTPTCPIGSFGRALLLECKNQGKKISADQVSRFAGKLKEAHLPGGVLVTLSGVSGNDDELTAARAELDKWRARDGIVIVVLERPELEAVATGEHLAAALERKFMTMSVWGQHEVVPPNLLGPPGSKVMTGAFGIRKAINDSRRIVIDEVLERSEPAPPDVASGVDAIRVALDDVIRAVEVASQLGDDVYAGPRASLIGLARLCVAQIALIDPLLYEAGAVPIRSNIMTRIPERLPVQVGRRVWRALTASLAEELGSDHDALDAALIIAGLSVEAIASIDDYSPEPGWE